MENEELEKNVTDVTENVDTTTEEIKLEDTETSTKNNVSNKDKEESKLYTDEQLNDILAKRTKRLENKIRKEYEKKTKSLKDLEYVVKTGLNKNNLEEATAELKQFYKTEGIDIPDYNINKKYYNEQEEKILAEAEANEIINSNDVDNEIKSLENIESLSFREGQVLEHLKKFKKDSENLKELKKIGAEEYIENKEFLTFKKNFNEDVQIKDIFSMFEKINNSNKSTETIGSMKNNVIDNETDYITEEEYKRLKSSDFEKPTIMQKIKNSIKKGILTP